MDNQPMSTSQEEFDRHAIRGTMNDPRFTNEVVDDAPIAEIPHAMIRLEHANNQLHEVVKVLHERLYPIRHESPKQESDQNNTAQRAYGSELAQSIANKAAAVELANQVIIKILNEIEV